MARRLERAQMRCEPIWLSGVETALSISAYTAATACSQEAQGASVCHGEREMARALFTDITRQQRRLTAVGRGQFEHIIKHGSPDTVLSTLRAMRAEVSTREGEGSVAVETLDSSLAYLEKRRAQIEYARFQAAGYPLGSGSVESANKLVVEARLKGAGMHMPCAACIARLHAFACGTGCGASAR